VLYSDYYAKTGRLASSTPTPTATIGAKEGFFLRVLVCFKERLYYAKALFGHFEVPWVLPNLWGEVRGGREDLVDEALRRIPSVLPFEKEDLYQENPGLSCQNLSWWFRDDLDSTCL